MMKALTFSQFGSSNVLEYIDVPKPKLTEQDVLVEMKAIGLNFADIYRRRGTYHLRGVPPYIAGYEGAGIIVDNNGHEEYKVGDRVAFADVPFANAEYVSVPTSHILPLPSEISFEVAASILLQGLTALYLSTKSHNVQPNEVILIHAASGGVGQFLTQFCKLNSAKVVGLTTSEHKKEIILQRGADKVFNLKSENWKEEIKNFTGGKGVDVVYDSVGSTLMDSFEVTKDTGKVVFYGMSGGNPPLVDPRFLMDTSKTLTGCDLWSYFTTKEERVERSKVLFDFVIEKKITLSEFKVFKLAEGKEAHDFLESGSSSGKVLLIP